MDRYLRTRELLGDLGFEILKKSSVAVFGLGGVGSYAAESLARSGVGTLWLYDNDTVSESNINRQLIAFEDTVGSYKTELEKQRCLRIDPDVNIFAVNEFVTPQSVIPFDKFDFIIDAVDNVTAKLFIAESADKYGVPMISIMGTGNKLCPERLRIDDIFKTRQCPLCRVMRSQLKKRGISGLNVVWSDEMPRKSGVCSEPRATGRPSPASCAFVPGCAGLMAASYAVRTLVGIGSGEKNKKCG